MGNQDADTANQVLDDNGVDYDRKGQALGDRDLTLNDVERDAPDNEPAYHPYDDNDNDDNESRNSWGRPGSCRICYDDVPEDDRMWLDCGDLWCKSYLRDAFDKAWRSEHHYPPMCCSDYISIDFQGWERVFDNEFIEQYKAKEVEYMTPGQHRQYCGNPSCSVFLDFAFKEEYTEPVVICRDCGSTTCTGCKTVLTRGDEPFDGNDVCESSGAVPGNLEYSTENRVKRFPSCRTSIQLAEACNHMTCGICHWDFCFVCLDRYPCENDCPQYGDPEYDAEGFDEHRWHRDTALDREGHGRDGYNLRRINREGRRRLYHAVPGRIGVGQSGAWRGRGGRGRRGGHAGRGGRGGGRGGAFVGADDYNEDYYHGDDPDAVIAEQQALLPRTPDLPELDEEELEQN